MLTCASNTKIIGLEVSKFKSYFAMRDLVYSNLSLLINWVVSLEKHFDIVSGRVAIKAIDLEVGADTNNINFFRCCTVSKVGKIKLNAIREWNKMF